VPAVITGGVEESLQDATALELFRQGVGGEQMYEGICFVLDEKIVHHLDVFLAVIEHSLARGADDGCISNPAGYGTIDINRPEPPIEEVLVRRVSVVISILVTNEDLLEGAICRILRHQGFLGSIAEPSVVRLPIDVERACNKHIAGVFGGKICRPSFE